MFEHPALRRVRAPDVNGRIWFRIDPGQAVEGAKFVVSQLTGTAEVMLPAPSSGPEGVVIIESDGAAYRCLRAGHGWSHDWEPIEAEALVALIVSLVPHAASVNEDSVYCPTTHERKRSGFCELHPQDLARAICTECLRELCATCYPESSCCRACLAETEARRERYRSTRRWLSVVGICVFVAIVALRLLSR